MKLSLTCAVVGKAGESFGVEVDSDVQVWKLRDKIKKAIKHDLKGVDENKLEVFLAKMESAWLPSDSDVVKQLKKGETTGLIEALTKKDQVLQSEQPLDAALNGMDPPSPLQIHVLVMVPARGNALDGLDGCPSLFIQ